MRPQDVEGWVAVLEAPHQAGIHEKISGPWYRGLKKKNPGQLLKDMTKKPIISPGGG